jgi:hypothetical protein
VLGPAKSNLATIRMVEMLASMSSTNKDLDAKPTTLDEHLYFQLKRKKSKL